MELPASIHFGYHDLTLCAGGPPAKPGSHSDGAMMVCFHLDGSVASLFPYINAVADGAELYQNPMRIRFRLDDYYCILYPESGFATPFYDDREAFLFAERLLEFFEDIYLHKDEIVAKNKVFNRVSVIEILKLLPKTNCRECGFPTCMAFAAALSQQETNPERCSHMGLPISEKAVYPVYDDDGSLRTTVTIDVDTLKIKQQNQSETAHSANVQSKFSKSGKGVDNKVNASLPAPLTARELEVLHMLAHGDTNTEISHNLNISPHTVKSHVIHIFNKLGVNDRTQAAVWATRHNLV